jgi:hypothetical protein
LKNSRHDHRFIIKKILRQRITLKLTAGTETIKIGNMLSAARGIKSIIPGSQRDMINNL